MLQLSKFTKKLIFTNTAESDVSAYYWQISPSSSQSNDFNPSRYDHPKKKKRKKKTVNGDISKRNAMINYCHFEKTQVMMNAVFLLSLLFCYLTYMVVTWSLSRKHFWQVVTFIPLCMAYYPQKYQQLWDTSFEHCGRWEQRYEQSIWLRGWYLRIRILIRLYQRIWWSQKQAIRYRQYY